METKRKPPHINVDFFEDLTGDISETPHDGVEEIGKRIRILREEKGISLDELSNMTGFDVELLSNIENNIVQPQQCFRQVNFRDRQQNLFHNSQR